MQSERPQVSGLDHLVLTVRDVAATVTFYCDVLGMTPEVFHAADGSTRTAVIFGAQKINLHDAAAPFAPHAASPAPGTADLCFLSPVPLADWIAHFATRRVAIVAGPVARTGAAGPILSVYIRDPDCNLIEVANLA